MNNTISVILRKDIRDNTLVAIFPDQLGSCLDSNTMVCFTFDESHGICTKSYYHYNTVPVDMNDHTTVVFFEDLIALYQYPDPDPVSLKKCRRITRKHDDTRLETYYSNLQRKLD
jgi:hypothetical protein